MAPFLEILFGGLEARAEHALSLQGHNRYPALSRTVKDFQVGIDNGYPDAPRRLYLVGLCKAGMGFGHEGMRDIYFGIQRAEDPWKGAYFGRRETTKYVRAYA